VSAVQICFQPGERAAFRGDVRITGPEFISNSANLKFFGKCPKDARISNGMVNRLKDRCATFIGKKIELKENRTEKIE
jgi:hypothetical protein